MEINTEVKDWMERVLKHNQSVYCEDRVWRTGGIFYHENPLEVPFVSFILQLIMMGLAYQLIYFLFRPLKQPKFVCSVLAGILISPKVLGMRWLSNQVIFISNIISAIGVGYFIFIVSIKMDVSMIRRAAKDATVIGVSTVVAPFITILILCMHVYSNKELFWVLFSAGLSVTRFPNIAYAFDELNLLTSELGQLVLSCSMIAEMLSWVWLLIGMFIRSQNNHSGWYFLVSATIFFLVAVFIIRPIMKWIVRITPEGEPVESSYVMGIIVGALFASVMADSFGSMQLGALVIGLVIPDGPPLGSEIVKKAELVVMEIFMPIFYICVGYNTDLSSLKRAGLKEVCAIVILGFVTKLLGGLFPALSCGIKLKHASLLGLMMNIKGPLDLHRFNRWLWQNEIEDPTYTLLVLSHVLITGMVTPFIEIFYGSNDRLNSMTGDNKRAVQTTPKDVELRILSCIYNEDNVLGTLCFLKACSATETSPICVYLVQCEELVGRSMPVIIPHNNAMTRGKSKISYKIMRAVGKYLTSSDGFTKIKTYSVIAPYKSMHENINMLAHKEKVPLIIVPFHKINQVLDYAQYAALHNVNMKIAQWAPCTVGILVDKGFHRSCMKRDDHFTCNVAVIFIGGADDREALSISVRMSRHLDVHLTILYIKKMNETFDPSESSLNKKLDDAMLNEFKMNVVNNRRVEFREAYADNGESIISAVRSLEDKYDLVIMGRQSEVTKNDFNELTLSVLNEHPELGILGDIVASKDFHGGMTSVLVMQYGGRDLPRFVPDNVNQECDNEYLLKRQGLN